VVNPSVLIVDDDADIREAMETLLSSVGYQVLTAEHGGEALSLLRSLPSPPGLILLDLMMPVMNGWQFLDEQRRDPTLAAIPIAILTGGRQAPTGVPRVLQKPVNLNTLLSLVASHCGDVTG
jgi:CheY-like chemotaxis protein